MKKNINITKLAEYCGCSPSTISRVFNGNAPVSREKREKIIRAAEKFNYRAVAPLQKNTVALVIADSQHILPPSWFTCHMVAQLLDVLTRNGYRVTLCRLSEVRDLDPREIVAGVLLDWVSPPESLKPLLRLKIPFIGLNVFHGGFNTVCSDHAGQMLAAVRYLMRRGHKDIVYFEPGTSNWGSVERRRGALLAFEEAGSQYRDNFTFVWDKNMRLEKEKIKRMFIERSTTAVVCLHEDWVVLLYHILLDLGFKIGEDVSLVTSEVACMMDMLSPGITTLGQNFAELSTAVIQIVRNIEDKPNLMSGITHYFVPCQLHERSSVKKLE